jgi:hypothetical protein
MVGHTSCIGMPWYCSRDVFWRRFRSQDRALVNRHCASRADFMTGSLRVVGRCKCDHGEPQGKRSRTPFHDDNNPPFHFGSPVLRRRQARHAHSELHDPPATRVMGPHLRAGRRTRGASINRTASGHRQIGYDRRIIDFTTGVCLPFCNRDRRLQCTSKVSLGSDSASCQSCRGSASPQ